MNTDRFKKILSDPFSKNAGEIRSELSIQKLQHFVKVFAVFFVIAMILLVGYQLSRRALSFSEKLINKDEVYFFVKPTNFRSSDPPPVDTDSNQPSEVERVYRTQVFKSGLFKYKAVIAYWNLDDVPSGTVYKKISPYDALLEIQNTDRYDGIVFWMSESEQEYYGRGDFSEVLKTLKSEVKSEIRIKD